MCPDGSGRRASRLPTLGRHGEGWVAGQLVLIAAVFLSAFVGRSWRSGYGVAAYAIAATLLALGLLLVTAAGRRLGASLTPFPAPRAGQNLRMSGPYALARHPMYGGVVLIALGWAISFASLLGLGLTIALALVLDLKARREEVWLGERYDDHDAYRKRTPRKLLPFIY